MSDTPRTDANLGKHLTRTGFPVVDPVFARQLERELDAANERIKRLIEALELLVCASEDVQKKGYAFAQLDRGVVMARTALGEAKETKP